ncbi:HNH endonuclease signature motif containing protein [Sanguibacter keddieii]|nr:HNH endonuclease signature motif containing protein [Sanguibacter keddieii]
MNHRQGELVDAVVAGFAEVAAAQARCARRVDDLRRWSQAATDAVARGRGEEAASLTDQRSAERWLVSEVACALQLPEGSASALVADSQALVHEHPATMAALSQGEVSYRHAEAVLGATVGLDETSRLELDVLLSERARTTTVAALKRVARRERERRDSRPLVERHQVATVERHVELRPCQDGMAWLHQYLPAVQATAIFNRLTDIAMAVQGPDEPRTLAQLRADASVDLLLDDDARTALTAATVTGADGNSEDRAVAASEAAPHYAGEPTQSIAGVADRVSLGGIKPQVAVTIPVMTLLGHSDEPGELAGHGPIDAHTARRLAAQAPSFLRILTHPETGTVLSVGRDRYAVPADLKTWLRIRDETCRFPGCSRRAQRCDIDHVKDWAHGGTTDHHNLIHLCRHHHRLKHTTAWTVSTGPPGSTPPDKPSSRQGAPYRAPAHHDSDLTADVVHWTAPTGRTYLDHAAVQIASRQAEVAALSAPHPVPGPDDEPPF